MNVFFYISLLVRHNMYGCKLCYKEQFLNALFLQWGQLLKKTALLLLHKRFSLVIERAFSDPFSYFERQRRAKISSCDLTYADTVF